MNWEAIGAIGELVAAVGVIASLLFVGLQVRKVNLDTKARATEQMAISYRDLLFQAMPYTDILREGVSSFSGLSSDEQMKFHIWMTAHLLDAQNQYRQLKYDSRSDDDVEALFRFNAMMLKAPGGNEWWQYAKLVYDVGFISLMEQEIENTVAVGEVLPWFKGDDT
jgi:hypothetical protein